MKLLFTIILTILLIFLSYIKFRTNKCYENYYDITPYQYHYNIFRCLDDNCIREESKKCYDWCDNWGEPGGRHNCRMRCLDYADIQHKQVSFSHYTFNKALPRFYKFSILNKNKKVNCKKDFTIKELNNKMKNKKTIKIDK